MAEPGHRDCIVCHDAGVGLRRGRYLATDLINAVHEEVESPGTDRCHAEAASHTGCHESPAIPQTSFH